MELNVNCLRQTGLERILKLHKRKHLIVIPGKTQFGKMSCVEAGCSTIAMPPPSFLSRTISSVLRRTGLTNVLKQLCIIN